VIVSGSRAGEALLHERIHLGAGRRIVDRDGNTLRGQAVDPLEDDILFPQQVFRLVGNTVETAVYCLIHIDAEHQVHAALQVEAQVNGVEGLFPPIGQRLPDKRGGQGNERENQASQNQQSPPFETLGHGSNYLLSAAYRRSVATAGQWVDDYSCLVDTIAVLLTLILTPVATSRVTTPSWTAVTLP
jgi:hypothetical protein